MLPTSNEARDDFGLGDCEINTTSQISFIEHGASEKSCERLKVSEVEILTADDYGQAGNKSTKCLSGEL